MNVTARNNLLLLRAFVVAIVAALAVQIVIGLVSELLPASDTVQDKLSQFASSIVGSWVWVRVGAALSPRPLRVGAAYLFALVAGLFSLGLFAAQLLGFQTGYAAWWLLICTAAAISALFLACVQVYRIEVAAEELASA